jgi:serine-type D-Ala-D-Ala carboxypeptidase/endopeptidase (penicillin-binding protein 4)
MNMRVFLVFLFFFVGRICFCQSLFDQKVKDLQAHPLMKGALTGICILNLGNGSVSYAINQDQLMVPASTLKLVSSAAALEILGPAYRFKTQLAYSGQIHRQTHFLDGDLLIIGGGDPALGSIYFPDSYGDPPFLDQWVQALILKGIRGINGSLCIDESAYEEQTVPPGWVWEDIGNHYGAGAGALAVYDNRFRITFQTGKEAGQPAAVIHVDPWAEELRFENYVTSSDHHSDNAYVYGSPWGKIRKIRGTIPVNRDSFRIKASLPEPGIVLAKSLKSKLERTHIPVSGNVIRKEANEITVPIHEVVSPPLSAIVKVLNHESVNLFAEHLVKQLAWERNGLGSTRQGIKIIREFWSQKGLDTTTLFMEDGSGLSRSNALSPRHLTEILLYMKNESPYSELFTGSLPEPGEGTLIFFDPARFPNQSLRCKSGSMTRVRCFAGYLVTVTGEELAFSIMLNNFSMKQSELIEKVEDLLVTLRKKGIRQP